ncbi:MAG: AbgT family transporter, partial [bacterium]|nr:AbgT family transporter [bacterium]
NKLPDPAFLFLIGLFIVLGLSHFASPDLPSGFEVRWVDDPTREGGVDEQRGVIGRVSVTEEGEVFEPASIVVEDDDPSDLKARLVIDATGEIVAGPDGEPVNVADRGWAVFEKIPVDTDGDPETPPQLVTNGKVMFAQSLITSEGWYWLLSSMEANFLGFAPLGVVLLGMLGIGPMERVGLISALLRAALSRVPGTLLTPAMIFLGIMSSLGSDAGYVVLPPLAALAYLAVGRSPLAGIAAVFAGVAAGFNANLLITSLEPLMSNLSQDAAQTIDADRAVAATAAWYFMAASTIVLTFVGWAVTAMFVEKRLAAKSPEDGGAPLGTVHQAGIKKRTSLGDQLVKIAILNVVLVVISGLIGAATLLGDIDFFQKLADAVPGYVEWPLFAFFATIGTGFCIAGFGSSELEENEVKGLQWATVVFALGLAFSTFMVFWEGSPLHGTDGPFPRWVAVIVPLMFVLTILPACVYGAVVGNIKSTKDAAQTMVESMAAMAPIIVLAFFAGQFVAAFEESGLGRMLAFSGGEWLFNQQFGAGGLLIAFILVTMVFNLFVGSMSAKYALFAPIFVPMFMLIGIRPEMTQTAYRIGDSTTNIITPLNPYMVIILMYVQKYAPKAGIGTLIAMMLPYTVAFTLVWMVMIVVWQASGVPLGVGDPVDVFSEGYGVATP